MAKKALLIITSGLTAAILTLTASDAQAIIPCPLVNQANRQIIILNNTTGRSYILASVDLNWATLGPVSTDLPSGSYRITLVSYDDHAHKIGQIQPQEMWYLKLKNASGTLLAQTSSINDLPDDQNWLTQEVNANLLLSASVKSVTALHSAFYNSNPNSINPICAAFDKKAELASVSLLSLNGLTGRSSFTTSLKAAASYNGLPSDTVNYTFWWNCDSASTDIAYLRQSAVCGDPLNPVYGVKYDGEPGGSATTFKQTPSHTYPSGTFTPKVIIERGTAEPTGKMLTIEVSNDPPTLSNLIVSEPDYCFSGPGGTVSWDYTDAESDAQAFYRLQVDVASGSFTSPVYDSGKLPSAGLSTAPIPQTKLAFDTVYQARMMVWDAFGSASSWANSLATWITPKHHYPRYNPFTWQINAITMKGLVKINFFNQSTCYDQNNLPAACERWEYDFDYPSGTDSYFNPNPTHNYFSTGPYQVKETVIDTENYACSDSPQDISITILPLTGSIVWKEVWPF